VQDGEGIDVDPADHVVAAHLVQQQLGHTTHHHVRAFGAIAAADGLDMVDFDQGQGRGGVQMHAEAPTGALLEPLPADKSRYRVLGSILQVGIALLHQSQHHPTVHLSYHDWTTKSCVVEQYRAQA